MPNDFIGINHGKKQMRFASDDKIVYAPVDLRPIEIHLKEDGAIDDGPSFCMVLSDMGRIKDYERRMLAQISLKMFNEGLTDIGYQIIKL